MKRVLCDGSSPACGCSLTNGVGDLWRPAKLSPWDTEEFRGFDAPVPFPEKPLPRGSARSLTDRKSTRLNTSHRCISYAVLRLEKIVLYESHVPHLAQGVQRWVDVVHCRVR